MDSVKSRSQAALISVIASALIFAIKVWGYQVTHSAAVLSDALESIVNVIASVVTLFVVRFAAQPADIEHPYGHGKAEYFSAAFEGGMIFFAALMIANESIRSLFSGEGLHELSMGMTIIGAAAVVNLSLSLYLKHIGNKHHSEALKASAAHVLSDVWTTVGIIAGLGLVLLTGYSWLDPLIAILVAVQLAYAGYKIVRGSLGGLIDAADVGVIKNLAASFEKNRSPGIIDIHHLRVIRSGSFHHVDAHLVVPEFWDVSRAHQQTHDFETSVVRDYPVDGEMAFHLDPCERRYCSICDVLDCPIRQTQFKQRREFKIENLITGPKPDDGTKTTTNN